MTPACRSCGTANEIGVLIMLRMKSPNEIALPFSRFVYPPSLSNPPLFSQQPPLARTSPLSALALPCLGPRNRDPFGLTSSVLVSSDRTK